MNKGEDSYPLAFFALGTSSDIEDAAKLTAHS